MSYVIKKGSNKNVFVVMGNTQHLEPICKELDSQASIVIIQESCLHYLELTPLLTSILKKNSMDSYKITVVAYGKSTSSILKVLAINSVSWDKVLLFHLNYNPQQIFTVSHDNLRLFISTKSPYLDNRIYEFLEVLDDNIELIGVYPEVVNKTVDKEEWLSAKEFYYTS